MTVHTETASPGLWREIWLQIHQEDYPWVVARLYSRLQNWEDAQDIASEACIQLVTSPSLEQVRVKRAMLMTISERLAWKQWRRRELEASWREHWQLQASADCALSAHEYLEICEALHAVDAVLQSLPFKARTAFVCSQIDGMKHAEIAALLGISVSCVRKYITKALLLCCQACDG
ncbi:RNA polymerase sigma-70 factor, ECF subfamily [Lampropedia hyalina DSM 16112]|jgi:RNA polymerase sigma-70 factor (ECF subfamily)|uniref:RNA polymerase sigma-70 factor, ECF subfamily n=1 Tax=Lampropedia hyalina DSM 16112 TaxID=1122156 RepID=A0A1M4VYJ0_9BURK|nr:sigma-70 family RNA polymerase sigma factor [Lampropedia hyalina]SHE73970.1 RNA polymerase sigma-70 factor, ECF subfamily [Lampropedia hyalina DSM 16112]